MTKKQSAFIKMCKAVTNVLTNHAAIVATIPALVVYQADLAALLEAMEAYGETQEDADDSVFNCQPPGKKCQPLFP